MQAREGQRVRGPNGEMGVWRNGQIEIVQPAPAHGAGVPQMIVPPTRLPPAQTPAQAAVDEARAAAIPAENTQRDLTIQGQALTNEDRRRTMGRMPETAAQNLTQDIDSFAALSRAASAFQDDYSGFGAGVENTAQRYGADFGLATPGQNQWWADFAAADNAARNRLFGASLTPTEAAAYERTSITPGMSPEEVRDNLNRRMELARAALRRRVNFLRESGYDSQAIDALLGEYGSQLSSGAEQAEPSDPNRQPGYERTPGDSLEYRPGDEGGAFSTERDRETAAAVRQMIQQGREAGEIASYLQGRGHSANIGELRAAIRARRENRPWSVIPPESGSHEPSILNRVANSPLGAGVVSSSDTLTGGHLDNLVGLAGGDADRANYDMQQLRQRNPVPSLFGDIAGGASVYGAGRAAVSRFAPRLLEGAATALRPAAIAGDAGAGAYVGSGSGTTDPFSVSGMARGSLMAVPFGIAGRGTINALGRAASPTGGELAPLYREGVEPTLGQRVGGAMDRFEQATTSVPFLGGIPRRARNRAIEQFQEGAFNQALREIGQALPEGVRSGTKAHRFMQRAFNNEFRDVRRQMSFTPDQQFGVEFGQLQQGLMELGDESRRIFERMVRNNVSNRLRRYGRLTGDDYIQAASRFDARARQLRRSPNGDNDLADALESFSTMLDDAAARQSPPELGQRLTAARAGYRRAVVIEDAARRRGGSAGEFSPVQLDAAVQNIGGGLRSRAYLRGDAPMQEYATAGLRLGDTLANSGTTDRILASGAIGTAGWASPLTLTPLAGSLAANAPVIRPAVNALLAPNRQQLDPIREALMRRAHYPSVLAPALVAETQ